MAVLVGFAVACLQGGGLVGWFIVDGLIEHNER